MARRKKPAGNTLSVDFSGVETRGRFREEGDYLLRVRAASQEEGDKFPYISWELEAADDDNEGAVCYNNTSLSPKSLWNLKAFLEALGVEVPDDSLDLDLDELVGLEFMGRIEMETYEGKPKPVLADFWAAEEDDSKAKGKGKKKPARGAKDDEDDDEDDKPARGKRGKKPAKAEVVTEDEVNDMDEEELGDFIKEHKLKVDLDEYKTLRKMRSAVVDAATEKGILGEGDDDDDDDDDEDDKPAAKGRRGKKPADDEEDEDEDDKPARRRSRSRR